MNIQKKITEGIDRLIAHADKYPKTDMALYANVSVDMLTHKAHQLEEGDIVGNCELLQHSALLCMMTEMCEEIERLRKQNDTITTMFGECLERLPV